MANWQLINYIREQLKRGYDLDTLKKYLIKQGYTQKDVDDSLNYVGLPNAKRNVPKPLIYAVIAVSILIAVLILTLYIYSNKPAEPVQLLDLKTSIITSNVLAGNKVEFNVGLINLGTALQYNINLKYEILGTYISKEETTSVETSVSKKSFIDIPTDLTPKRYTLKITASYAGKQAYSTLGFNVLASEKEKCTENWECSEWQPIKCPVSQIQTRNCNDLNNCGTRLYKPETEISCIYGAEQYSKTTEEPEPEKLLQNIIGSSKTDFSKALWDCGSFNKTSVKDVCYLSISTEANNQESCPYIENDLQRDQCYITYSINNKDYSICDQLTNLHLKMSCESLKDMPTNY